MTGQYERRPSSQAQQRARTIHNRYGSWEKASEAVGVSHNTLRSYARGDTKPTQDTQTKMNRMVGQYKSRDSSMKEITQTALRQDRIAERRRDREDYQKGIIDAEDLDDSLAAKPLWTKPELEYVTDLLEDARDSDDSDDWSMFRNAYTQQ